jgi:hypothetical protein
MIILPGQARDKHREKLKKERNAVSAGPIRLASDPSLALFIAPVAPVAPDGVALMIGAGNAHLLRCHFMLKMIIRARQARDKRRKSSTKAAFPRRHLQLERPALPLDGTED